tara:strand:- start:373 stop:1161 length:789 start_codon:yes stop_codon:yes gene_type:complete
MADLHRVEINEKAPQEVDPESEEAVDAVSEEQTQETQEDRPDWLPEKFKSAEDMANAYSELEKKLGAGANEQKEEQQEEQPTNDEQNEEDNTEQDTNTNDVIVEASKEFFENDGVISEETYKNLAEIGLPKELVDSYAAGQQALMQSEEGSIKAVADGNWDQMAEWAANNLSQEEIDTFDDIVQSGTVEQAKLAAKGLYAQYKAENGVAPRLTQGAVNGSSTMPFKSNQELARAMSDPRYKSGDKAYHEEIDRRIAVSHNYI